jgi:hypothetical protein
MKHLLIGAFAVLSLNAMAEEVYTTKYELQMSETYTMKSDNEAVFNLGTILVKTSPSQVIDGVTSTGQVTQETKTITDQQLQQTLTVDKDFVKIISNKAPETVLKAKVSRTWGGKIKSITFSSDVVRVQVAKQVAPLTEGLLSGLAGLFGYTTQTAISNGDQVCSLNKEGSLLTCQLNATVIYQTIKQ